MSWNLWTESLSALASGCACKELTWKVSDVSASGTNWKFDYSPGGDTVFFREKSRHSYHCYKIFDFPRNRVFIFKYCFMWWDLSDLVASCHRQEELADSHAGCCVMYLWANLMCAASIPNTVTDWSVVCELGKSLSSSRILSSMDLQIDLSPKSCFAAKSTWLGLSCTIFLNQPHHLQIEKSTIITALYIKNLEEDQLCSWNSSLLSDNSSCIFYNNSHVRPFSSPVVFLFNRQQTLSS